MDKSIVNDVNIFSKILTSALPNLKKYSYLAGSEGRVYFVDDNFVIKEFVERKNAKYFDAFCEELKGFAEKGYSVPMIYAWCKDYKHPNFDQPKMYILEERVRGSVLFQRDMTKIFDRCKAICDEASFVSVMKNKKSNPELFSLILREYLRIFLETNKSLLELPESEIEKFVNSYYQMQIQGRYSLVDAHAKNVMFDGKTLTHIDNGFLEEELESGRNVESIVSLLLRDMVSIFYENGELPTAVKKCKFQREELLRLVDDNKDVCFLSMKKFIKVAKQVLGTSKMDYFDYRVSESVSTYIFGADRSKSICSEFDTEENFDINKYF